MAIIQVFSNHLKAIFVNMSSYKVSMNIRHISKSYLYIFKKLIKDNKT